VKEDAAHTPELYLVWRDSPLSSLIPAKATDVDANHAHRTVAPSSHLSWDK
jgi:hypothetical protein